MCKYCKSTKMNPFPIKKDSELNTYDEITERLKSIDDQREKLTYIHPSRYPRHVDAWAKRDAKIAKLTERYDKLWVTRAKILKGLKTNPPKEPRIHRVSSIKKAKKLWQGYSPEKKQEVLKQAREFKEYEAEKLDLAIREAMKKTKHNPPTPAAKGAVKIYDEIEEIKAIKGTNSLWPTQPFKHSFKKSSKAAIYGLEDGSLLVKSQKGKRLWKNFKGYKKGIDY